MDAPVKPTGQQLDESSAKDTESRTLGATGLSIGTHLMLESLFDIEPYDASREFKKVKISKYKHHVYNIFTIIRNIAGSYVSPPDLTQLLASPVFPKMLNDELRAIARLYSGCECKPVIFYPDYSKLIKNYNWAKKDIETIPFKQHVAVTNFLLDYDKTHKIDKINKKGGYYIPKEYAGKDSLLTTHIYLDLFNTGDFSLIQSHTGALRTRIEFGKCYRQFGQHSFANSPWCEALYFLLGDHVFVKTCAIKVKTKIIELFTKYHVNAKSKPREVSYILRTDFVTGQPLARFFDQYHLFL